MALPIWKAAAYFHHLEDPDLLKLLELEVNEGEKPISYTTQHNNSTMLVKLWPRTGSIVGFFFRKSITIVPNIIQTGCKT